MPTQSLTEAAKRINNELNTLVAEDIFTINPWFRMLGFMSVTGQSLNIPRENVLGDAGFYGVGDTITHKNPSSVEKIFFEFTKLIADSEHDNLVQATSQSAGIDQQAEEVFSKSKRISRLFQQGIASGTGTLPDMHSFHTLVDSSQYTPASAGQPLSFPLLDEGLDLVTAKEGQVDAIIMPGRTMRTYRNLVRSVGGTTPQWILDQFGSRRVAEYEGIPIFQNDYLSTTETADGAALTGGALASVYCMTMDTGDKKSGVAAIYPEGTSAGIMVEPIGQLHDRDELLTRIKWYTNFVITNRRGVSRITSISD